MPVTVWVLIDFGSSVFGFAKLVVWSMSSPSPVPFCSSSSCASNCGEYSPRLISPDASTRNSATLIWPAASGTGPSSSVSSESVVKKSSFPDNDSTGASLFSPYRSTPFRPSLPCSSSLLPAASLRFRRFFSRRCFLRSILAATSLSLPSRSSPLSQRSRPTSRKRNSRSARPPPSESGTLTHREFTHVSSPRRSRVATSSLALPSKYM
jgi:hypothetical protein